MTKPREYPLSWPPGIKRHTRFQPAKFTSTLAAARENVFGSLRRFGTDSSISVKDVIISSNVAGISGRKPDDPGVAVWFMWDGEYRCIAVDRYSKVEWNLQAIHHVIEAERTKLRHGGLHIIRSTFRAYMALEAEGNKSWRSVLGIKSEKPTEAMISERWKALAVKHHPDKGGKPEMMAAINAARDAGLKEIREGGN